MVQDEPSVQVTVLTVVDALTRSAFVTNPVAVKAVVTVRDGAVRPDGRVVDTDQVPDDTCGTPVDDDVLMPVPPLPAASVPAKVTAPEVALFGVKPVVPAENVVTPPPDPHAPL